jgi:hypothetical protein
MDDLRMDGLQMSADEMRRAGYSAVDMLVRHLTDPEAPPLRRATATEMLATNVYASTWLESPGPSQVEIEVLGWFKEWIGYPETASGILVSGGSAANMTALACARESLVGPMSDDLVVFVPDQAQSSLARAARVLGACRSPIERTFAHGEKLISRWEGSRELYVVLGGEASIVLDWSATTAHAGDTIGEIAALAWGAGYGHARTALVTAETGLRALVFAAGDVGELVRWIPLLASANASER